MSAGTQAHVGEHLALTAECRGISQGQGCASNPPPQPISKKKGRFSSIRHKPPTLSTFASKKRAKSPSPSPALDSPPAKRLRVDSSVALAAGSRKVTECLESPAVQVQVASVPTAGAVNARVRTEATLVPCSGKAVSSEAKENGACDPVEKSVSGKSVTSSKPCPLFNGTGKGRSGADAANGIEDDRLSLTSSSSTSVLDSCQRNELNTAPKGDAKLYGGQGSSHAQESGGQRSSRDSRGQRSRQENGGQRPRQESGGQRSTQENGVQRSRSGTFRFNDVFGYYPSKLVLQDDDLCPEYSLSLSGMERSELNSLPPTHPIWTWTLGHPTNKASATIVKANRRRLKLKSSNMT